LKQSIGIDYVVTGSVRLQEDFVRLNVQLHSTVNRQVVFSEQYSKQVTAENLFDIQEEIVDEVLNAIADDNGIIMRIQFRGDSTSEAENGILKEAIHKYYQYTHDYNVEELPTTLEALEKAVAQEPGNADVSALLSLVYLEKFVDQTDYEPELLAKGRELALSSVRLDPESQHAYKALVWANLLSQKREKTLEAIEQCLRLNPKAASIVSAMALAYICLGEFERGLELLKHTSKLNRVIQADAKLAFALYYFYEGNFEESLKWIERLWHLKSTFVKILRLSVAALVSDGENDFSSAEARHLVKHSESIICRLITDGELKESFMSSLGRARATA
jgi:tetratricopeptide (TPR) repeat protein